MLCSSCAPPVIPWVILGCKGKCFPHRECKVSRVVRNEQTWFACKCWPGMKIHTKKKCGGMNCAKLTLLRYTVEDNVVLLS